MRAALVHRPGFAWRDLLAHKKFLPPACLRVCYLFVNNNKAARATLDKMDQNRNDSLLEEERNLSYKELADHVRKAGYSLNRRETRRELLDMYDIIKRVLVVNEKKTPPQLDPSRRKHGLELLKIPLDRSQAMRALEGYDHPKFERFLDLPPELRNQIYEYYFFSEYGTETPSPMRPLITRVSKQVSLETLSLFYSTITPILTIKMLKKYNRVKLGMGYNTDRFLKETQAVGVHAIRELKIAVCIHPDREVLDCDISIKRNGNISIGIYAYKFKKHPIAETVFQDIGRAINPGGLTVDDVHKITTALEKWLQ